MTMKWIYMLQLGSWSKLFSHSDIYDDSYGIVRFTGHNESFHANVSVHHCPHHNSGGIYHHYNNHYDRVCDSLGAHNSDKLEVNRSIHYSNLCI